MYISNLADAYLLVSRTLRRMTVPYKLHNSNPIGTALFAEVIQVFSLRAQGPSRLSMETRVKSETFNFTNNSWPFQDFSGPWPR